MVQKKTSLKDLEQRLVLPDKSTASSVLSGIGNGIMLTGMPLFAANSYRELANKSLNLSNKFVFCNLAAIGIGAVIGGLYGKKEADEINNYRQTLRAEITHLHKRMDERQAPAKSWVDEVKSEASEISR